MTIFIFISSLLGLMALGMPIAFALIGCGLALMYYMGFTDPQIVVQNMWAPTASRCWPCRSSCWRGSS